ncbi:MAG: phosphoenolpyruvate--protein phosphotransferase, partial [Candidatus Kapabacteria bacterium]|nr:phosphoenolpyruvate--protein phosphotransferase [Candidatus Kapabacteria bacterium]
TEQEQFEWYNSMAERMYPRPVTFRAYDIGTDKIVQGLPHEHNPALGMRGIRFLLQRKDLFATQLRAILRASRNKNVKLMLPMVSRVSEVEDTLTLLDICKRKLFEQEEDYDNYLPVGIMIETPAAAIMADKFAEIVDFFSIGTNDLTQYSLAADRMNELVAGIFDAFNPAVLRLMKQAVDAAKERNIKVSVCGDLGGHAAATELLVGMGIDELSVSTPLLLELKKRIRKLSLENAQSVFADAINCLRPSDVRQRVSAVRKKR